MKKAICDNCNALLILKLKENFSKKKCECGSDQLRMVSVRDNQNSYEYITRKGEVLKTIYKSL